MGINQGSVWVVGSGYKSQVLLSKFMHHPEDLILVARVKVGIGLVHKKEQCPLRQSPGDEG